VSEKPILAVHFTVLQSMFGFPVEFHSTLAIAYFEENLLIKSANQYKYEGVESRKIRA
jgi:hypothetical protein